MADKVPVGPEVGSKTAQLDRIQSGEEKQGGHDNTTISDIESQNNVSGTPPPSTKKQSAFKSLGLLDRFLAVWILLAIILGILLGNFAPGTAAALDRGRFVGVSVPIGMLYLFVSYSYHPPLRSRYSCRVRPRGIKRERVNRNSRRCSSR
jgi:hypothetical protein